MNIFFCRPIFFFLIYFVVTFTKLHQLSYVIEIRRWYWSYVTATGFEPNHLVLKRTLNHSASLGKWLSVHLIKGAEVT